MVVSTDSIGLYIPQNDTLTRTFQLTNEGGSDLYWSVGSGAVGADDMLNASSETVAEFRSRWANAMIPAPLFTSEIQQELVARMGKKNRGDIFQRNYSTLGVSNNNMANYKQRSSHKNSAYAASEKISIEIIWVRILPN